MRPQEIGCIASHIKAIKHWLDTSDSEYAIIMEDDCNFDTVQHWSWDWDYVMNSIPKNFDIFQMVMIKNDNVIFNIHKKEKFNYKEKHNHSWSTACYLIKRSYGEYLVKKHYVNNKYNIYNKILKLNVADVLLYNFGNAYSMPLFTHDMDMENSINHNHEEQHNKSKNNIDRWWKNQSNKYTKEMLFTVGFDFSKKEINNSDICFKIFHIDGESETSKIRTNLTDKATKELLKSFNEIDTPTIMISNKEEASEFFKNNKDIKIDPLGRFEKGWKYGELGIWGSNFSAIKNFSKTNYEYLILMEDDIVIGKHFNNNLVKYMEELPSDWDFFTVYIPKTGNIRYRK
jgi:GR25 family glycosyltransferase involved in LPS biosynthesis